MCDPTLIAGGAALLGSVYSSERQSSAAQKGRAQAAEQSRMVAEANAKRLEQERMLADQALDLQRRSQAAQSQAFRAQQAAAARQANEAKQAEIRRQTNISQGQDLISNMFGQFDNDFYTGRKQGYIDYATPQLQRQYDSAMQSLVQSLARSGNLSSSVRAKSMADLQQQYEQGLGTIGSQGSNYADQARAAIEAARSGLLSQNASLADPGVVRGLSESQIASLKMAPTYTPLGTIISGLIDNANQVAGVNKKKEPAGGVQLVANALKTSAGNIVQ